MSDIESYDGLCGNIPTFASSDLRIRCKYDINHRGPCSYEKYRSQFQIFGGCGPAPIDPEEGFLNSVFSDAKFNHHVIIIDSSNNSKIRKQ